MTSSRPLSVPCRCSSRLAAALDRRTAPRPARLFLGAVLARGRRTVSSWIREPSSAIGFNPATPPSPPGSGLVRARGRRVCWLLHSKGRVASEDVDEHLRHLLFVLSPHREALLAAAEAGVASFPVSWADPSHPDHGGPTLAAVCVAGIAELRAEITISWRSGRPTTAEPDAAANPDRRADQGPPIPSHVTVRRLDGSEGLFHPFTNT